MMKPGARLAQLRRDKGWTQQEAADRMSIAKSTYIKYENGQRGIRGNVIQQITNVFNVDANALFYEFKTVAVVGYAGAGAEVFAFSEGPGELERVIAPRNATEDTVAVQIRGDSLGYALEGWYAFYDERHSPPLESDLNQVCVVGLTDGRVFVKKLVHGQLRGRFNLISQYGAPIYDAEVEWCAPVTAYTRGDHE